MKKYNSILGAFFSGADGKGGYNAGYKQSALAKLYSSQDPAEQQMAVQGLARIDPEAAQKWQMDSEERVKKHAQLLTALGPQNPLAVQAWKTRIKPELVRMYGDQAAALPDIPDESIMQYAKQLASGSGAGQPKVHSQYMGDDGNIRVVLSDGTEKALGKYSPKYTPHFGADGTVSGYNPRTNELSPTTAPMAGGMQQVPQGADPMAGGLERINENIRVLKANGVPAEQINAWSEAEFAKLQQSVQGGVFQQPQQARVAVKPDAPKGRVRVMTAQEIATAGLPAGTSAQIGDDGKIEILNKPVVEPKKQVDANIVKQAAQLPALLRRVQRVMDASKNLGFLGVDGGKLDQYALYGSESASELESAVGQLRATLLPFVRVPGVGSQSDLEARLDSLQYPDASQPPAVRKRNIDEINAFIADLSRAYSSIIKDGGASQAPSGNGKYSVGQTITVGGKRYKVIGGDMNDPDLEELK